MRICFGVGDTYNSVKSHIILMDQYSVIWDFDRGFDGCSVIEPNPMNFGFGSSEIQQSIEKRVSQNINRILFNIGKGNYIIFDTI